MKKVVIRFFYILIILLLMADSLIYYFKKDFSRDKIFSLSDVSLNLLDAVEDKVQITYYVSDALKTMYPAVKDIKEFLTSYSKASKNVYLLIQDPAKTNKESILTNFGIYPQQIQTTEKNKTSYSDVFSSIILEYRGKTEVIPFVLSTESLEYDIDSRLKYLITEVPRRAALLCANGLSLETDYRYLIPWLESSGFICTQVEADNLPEMNVQIPLVVIGSSLLSAKDVANIEDFVMKGGNAAFCISSNNANIYGDWSVTPEKNRNLHDLLDFWGIRIRPELLLDTSNYRIRMQSPLQNNQVHNEYVDYPFWLVTTLSGVKTSHPAAVAYSGLEVYWISPLELFSSDTADVIPLVSSSTGAWLLKETKDGFNTNPFDIQIPDEATKGVYPVAAVLEGKINGFYSTGKSSDVRLFAVGDQYMLSNMIEYTNSPHNLDFFTNVMLWLSKEDSLLSIRKNGAQSNQLTKVEDENHFALLKKQTILVCFILLPLFVVVIYVVITLLRRRYNNE